MTISEAPVTTWRCTLCGAEASMRRTPSGWKCVGEEVACKKCAKARYVVRAIRMPVTHPVSHTWKELRGLLRPVFEATTRASNWVVRELAKADPGFGSDGKLSKMPKVEPDGVSLYLGVVRRWPVLDTNTASSLVLAVVSKYRQERFDVAIGKRSLPSFRYPVPIPVHNRYWSVQEGEDGGVFLAFAIARREKATVRLRGGPNYRRQLVAVRKFIAQEVKQGALAISEDGTNVMMTMVGTFERTESPGGFSASLVSGPGPSDAVSEIPVGPNVVAAAPAFLTLYNDERRTIYRWNADHVRGWIIAQDERMQRLREDMKAEKRLGRDRDGLLRRMSQCSEKHSARMQSFCHETSAQIVKHLQRRRIGTLTYVDRARDYMPHFPWLTLRTMLVEKASRCGINVITSGDAASESPGPLEG